MSYKIKVGEPFAESLYEDINKGKDTWIIHQNMKYNVLKVIKTDRKTEWNETEYELEIEPRKEVEQLTLF